MNDEVMNDLRSVPRWNLKVPLQIGRMGSDEPIGDAVDISVKGIRILTDQALPLKEPIDLWLLMPERGDNWKKVSLQVQGVWSKSHGESEVFETGCQFLKIDTSVLFAVQSLIDNQMSFG